MENKYITETYVTKKENPCGKGKGYPKITVGNNPLWRLKSKEEMEKFAKYPFNVAIGEQLIDGFMQTPGIAAIYLDLCYSQCRSAESPIARKAYADWSYSTQNYTSASVQYQASDLMMVREGLINGPVMMIVEAKRALALLNKSNPMNKYVRKHLVEACGFDFEDLYKNKAQFEGELNIKIRNFNDTFKIPNTSNLLKIRQNYFGRIFSDGMGSRTQYYVFVPESYAVLDETTLPTGTALLRLDRGQTSLQGDTTGTTIRRYTYESFFEVYNFLESKFLENQDVNKMMADTLATYKGALLQIPEYKDFEMAIEYDPVILTQIHNMDILSRISFLDNFDSIVTGSAVGWEVNTRLASELFGESPSSLETAMAKRVILCQDANGIAMSDNVIKFSANNGTSGSGFNFAYRRSCILDISSENPTVEDITDALAFKIGRKQISADDNAMFLSELYCATDIATRIVLYTFESEGIMHKTVITSQNIFNGTAERENLLLLPAIGQLSKFDYAPFIYPAVGDGSADTSFCKVVGDIYNPTTIGRNEICNYFNRSWYTILDTAVNTDSATNP